ncbi:MAG: tyrosine-protein phosphatase [Actinomycetia bacterium]|nr:tyrosine-protein phosphatase [Actinomycetes bacterium]
MSDITPTSPADPHETAPSDTDLSRPIAVVPELVREGDRLALIGADGFVEYSVSLAPDRPSDQWLDLDAGVEVTVGVPTVSSRRYVHLRAADGTTVVAGERLVPLSTTLNTRDLGGYVGRDDRRVRWRQLYRSDRFGELSDEDHDLLSALDWVLVCDYRGDEESAAHPSLLPPTIEVKRVPLADPREHQRVGLDDILSGSVAAYTADDMAEGYIAMLDEHAADLAGVIALAADSMNRPMAFHCTAGKDRTGLTAALVLRVLGVDRETVLHDYDLTNYHRSGRRLAELRPDLEAAGVDVDAVVAFFSAPRRALEAALEHLVSEHGSVVEYLLGPGALGAKTIDRLRAELLALEG